MNWWSLSFKLHCAYAGRSLCCSQTSLLFNTELWFFLIRIFSCTPFLACVAYQWGSILFVTTHCPFPVWAKFTKNFNFVVIAVAQTALFGLDFAIFGIIQVRKWTGGKRGNPCSMSLLRHRLLTRLLVRIGSTAALSRGVVRTSQAKTPIPSIFNAYHPPTHDMNVCGPCLTSGPAAQQLCDEVMPVESGTQAQMSQPGK